MDQRKFVIEHPMNDYLRFLRRKAPNKTHELSKDGARRCIQDTLDICGPVSPPEMEVLGLQFFHVKDGIRIQTQSMLDEGLLKLDDNLRLQKTK